MGGSPAWPCTWTTWAPEGQKEGELIVVSRLEKEMKDTSSDCTVRNLDFSPNCFDCFSRNFANSTSVTLVLGNLSLKVEFDRYLRILPTCFSGLLSFKSEFNCFSTEF